MNRAIYVGRVLLTALMLVFSMQIFRVLITTVIWNLAQFLPGPYSLAGYALVLFAFVMLVPLLLRLAGSRIILAASGLGIVVMRLAMQFVSEPLSLIILSSAGVVFFLWFYTAWIRSGFDANPEYASVIAIGFPSAIIIDITSRIFLMSYDLVWRKATWALITVSVAAVVALILLWLTVVHSKCSEEDGEPGFFVSLLSGAIGPWLYLAMALYQNAPAMTGITSFKDIQTQMIVCVTAAVGALLAAILTQKPGRFRLIISLPVALILIVSTWAIVQGQAFPVYFFIAGAIAIWAMPGFLMSGYEKKTKSLYGTSLGMFIGFVAMLVLVFLHANFKMFGAAVAAAVIIAVVTVLASLREIKAADWKKAKTGITVAGLFCIFSVFAVDIMALKSNVPMSYWLFPGKDIKVLTYNIHQGFDADYRMNLEGIISEIKKLNPEIICLQEVNRAQFSNGLVDCLLPISNALGMSYIYGANHDDHQYGNAILTRYPIKDWDNLKFFNNSTETRGTLHALIKVRQVEDKNGYINVFVTHLDHIAGPENVRAKQVDEVLQYWAKRQRSIIVGDFNAEPAAPEMKNMYSSGLLDALEIVGKKDIKTFWEGYGEPKPLKLDYIFVTPDLKVTDVIIEDSRASDHKPVIVDIVR